MPLLVQLMNLAIAAFVVPARVLTPHRSAAHSLCSISVVPWYPGPTSTYFLGVALSDTMVAGPDTIPLTGEPGHESWARHKRPVVGQVIELRATGGTGAATIDSALSRTNSRRALVVLWDYDAACRPTQWGRSARWAVVGEQMFVEAVLRPSNKWVNGLPTLDTFFAGQLVYPSSSVGVYREFQDSLAATLPKDSAPNDWLDAAALFDLVNHLPAECDWYRHPQEAAATLAAVERDHPSWRSHFPADMILRNHERRAVDPSANTSDSYLRHLCAA